MSNRLQVKMAKYKYSVVANELLTPTVRSIKLAKASGQKPMLFQPGQYASISLHDKFRPTTNRCFSIVSAPLNQSELEFAVRVGGEYTSALERLNFGDAVFVQGPYGEFTLGSFVRPHTFFAAGIGITPFMSMIRYASAVGLSSPIHLIYSCRTQDDIPFLSELLQLKSENPNLRLTFFIGEGSVDKLGGTEVYQGRITSSSINKMHLDTIKTNFMICGPGGYIQSVHHMLLSFGVRKENISHESFSQGLQQSNSALIKWPQNAYAAAGVLMLLAGSYVVGGDIIRTLPALAEEYDYVKTETEENLMKQIDNFELMVTSLPPQVDTNITPEPVERHVTVEKVVVAEEVVVMPTNVPVQVAPPVEKIEPAPTPVVIEPAPELAPVVTQQPKTKTRTRTS